MATWKWYGQGLLGQWGTTAARRIDFATDTIKCALCTSSYTPDQDAHDFYNDLTNEVTGTGYSAGGVTLTTKAVTYDSATNEIRFDFDDPSWTSATISGIRVAVLYKDTGVAGTSPLIGYVVLDGDQSVSGGTFTLVLDANGALKVTAS